GAGLAVAGVAAGALPDVVPPRAAGADGRLHGRRRAHGGGGGGADGAVAGGGARGVRLRLGALPARRGGVPEDGLQPVRAPAARGDLRRRQRRDGALRGGGAAAVGRADRRGGGRFAGAPGERGAGAAGGEEPQEALGRAGAGAADVAGSGG